MLADLCVGLRGWLGPSWADGYFPDDLPINWRLGFVSNEFSCVAVTAKERGDLEACESWLDDVDDEFRFVVEPGQEEVVSLLKGNVACLLGDSTTVKRTDVPVFMPCLDAGKEGGVWCDPKSPDLVVAVWQVEQVPTPLATRLYIEALDRDGRQTAVMLVFDGKAAPETARQARVIGDLMGL